MNTQYFLNLVAGNVFGTDTSPAIPTDYYIGLSTTAPTAAGTNVTEPAAAGGYARVRLESLSEPANGVVTNEAAISFPESTAAWGTVTHFVVYDSANRGSGNLLMFGTLTTPRVVEAATFMTIKAGFLNLSILDPTTPAASQS